MYTTRFAYFYIILKITNLKVYRVCVTILRARRVHNIGVNIPALFSVHDYDFVFSVLFVFLLLSRPIVFMKRLLFDDIIVLSIFFFVLQISTLYTRVNSVKYKNLLRTRCFHINSSRSKIIEISSSRLYENRETNNDAPSIAAQYVRAAKTEVNYLHISTV